MRTVNELKLEKEGHIMVYTSPIMGTLQFEIIEPSETMDQSFELRENDQGNLYLWHIFSCYALLSAMGLMRSS